MARPEVRLTLTDRVASARSDGVSQEIRQRLLTPGVFKRILLSVVARRRLDHFNE